MVIGEKGGVKEAQKKGLEQGNQACQFLVKDKRGGDERIQGEELPRTGGRKRRVTEDFLRKSISHRNRRSDSRTPKSVEKGNKHPLIIGLGSSSVFFLSKVEGKVRKYDSKTVNTSEGE